LQLQTFIIYLIAQTNISALLLHQKIFSLFIYAFYIAKDGDYMNSCLFILASSREEKNPKKRGSKKEAKPMTS